VYLQVGGLQEERSILPQDLSTASSWFGPISLQTGSMRSLHAVRVNSGYLRVSLVGFRHGEHPGGVCVFPGTLRDIHEPYEANSQIEVRTEIENQGPSMSLLD
jgi:hypothetical protein